MICKPHFLLRVNIDMRPHNKINKQCIVLNSLNRGSSCSHPWGLGTVFLHTGVWRVTQHLFIHGLFGSFLLRVFLHKLRQLSVDGLPRKGQREWIVCVWGVIARLMKLAHCSTPTHLGGTQMIKHDNAVGDWVKAYTKVQE